jgi:hypothetical protein
MWEDFPTNRYWFACPWVAARAGFAEPNRELPETTKLDAVTASQGSDNRSEDNVHDLFDVALE